MHISSHFFSYLANICTSKIILPLDEDVNSELDGQLYIIAISIIKPSSLG